MALYSLFKITVLCALFQAAAAAVRRQLPPARVCARAPGLYRLPYRSRSLSQRMFQHGSLRVVIFAFLAPHSSALSLQMAPKAALRLRGGEQLPGNLWRSLTASEKGNLPAPLDMFTHLDVLISLVAACAISLLLDANRPRDMLGRFLLATFSGCAALTLLQPAVLLLGMEPAFAQVPVFVSTLVAVVGIFYLYFFNKLFFQAPPIDATARETASAITRAAEYVQVRGQRLRIVRAGPRTGKPVLLLHGFKVAERRPVRATQSLSLAAACTDSPTASLSPPLPRAARRRGRL